LSELKLLLAGDVMTGRGIDQLLPHPVDPQLHEPVVRDARDYIRLAEARHGLMPRPVAPAYPWGDALAAMDAMAADVRIINLETAITTAARPWPQKDIHYRMHPDNISCLTAAKLDLCCLANNHSLDWGWNGLSETLHGLQQAGIGTVGAGLSAHQAQRPAVLPLPPSEPTHRLLVFAWAVASSGVPPSWAVDASHPGVAFLPHLDGGTARWLARFVLKHRRPGDRILLSLHWGANWVPAIPESHQWFARLLIDLADIDVVFGHSSHHPLPFEIYRDKLILYGCGDLLNDYEGIDVPSSWRSDLGCLYGVQLDSNTGNLLGLDILPWLIRRFQLQEAGPTDQGWLNQQLNLEAIAEQWPSHGRRGGGFHLQRFNGGASAPPSCQWA
jgi:poly-gamma-glutamate capsule biosynthesis protein CapA/YwtB (metallophosphatase superfamily)